MAKIFCVEFQRWPLKFHTKYLAHTMKDIYFIERWSYKSSVNVFETVLWTSIWEQPPPCHSKIAWFHLDIDRITISTSWWITYEPITEPMTRRVTYCDENHGYTMQIWFTVSNLFSFFSFFLFVFPFLSDVMTQSWTGELFWHAKCCTILYELNKHSELSAQCKVYLKSWLIKETLIDSRCNFVGSKMAVDAVLTCKVLHHFVWTQRPFWIICTVQSLSEIMAD